MGDAGPGPDLQTYVTGGLTLLLVASLAVAVWLALDRSERIEQLKARSADVGRLTAAAQEISGAAAEAHDSLQDVIALARARGDSLEQLADRQGAAADTAEAVAVDVRPRLEENLDELVEVVHPPAEPLARTIRAQTDSVVGSQRTTIDLLRGQVTSLRGVIAERDREIEACIADVDGCHRARRELETAVDSLTALNDDLVDELDPGPLQQLFRSWPEGVARVVATAGAFAWDPRAGAGAVGIQVVEVTF
jgi:tetrahydromethanopterin S-methyltransferase subunit B